MQQVFFSDGWEEGLPPPHLTFNAPLFFWPRAVRLFGPRGAFGPGGARLYCVLFEARSDLHAAHQRQVAGRCGEAVGHLLRALEQLQSKARALARDLARLLAPQLVQLLEGKVQQALEVAQRPTAPSCWVWCRNAASFFLLKWFFCIVLFFVVVFFNFLLFEGPIVFIVHLLPCDVRVKQGHLN